MGWVNAGAKKSGALSSYPFEAKKILLARNALMPYHMKRSIRRSVMFPQAGKIDDRAVWQLL
jgi:hypothetical protein